MPLLERDAELAALDARLHALERGTGGAVLIEGVAGIGKSTLLEELVARARARPAVQVLTARGTELELDLAFGAVRQLFTPVVTLAEDERAGLLAGPAALAAPVLGLGTATGGGLADPLYALFWLTANLAERAPVLAALDDLHWLDPESGRYVAYLARRLEGLPVLLVGSARPREPGAMATPLDVFRESAEILSPGPLSADAAGAVLAGAAGAAEAHRATGGNPFLLTELARALQSAAPGAPVAALPSGAVAESVLRRVRRISPAAVALTEAVAVFPAGAVLGDAAAVSGLSPGEAAAAADALIEADVLAGVTPRLEFLHPLMRAAVYDRLGRFARRSAHATAAAVLRDRGAGAEEIAAHLLAGEPAGDPANVLLLRAAAATAVAAVAPRAAIRYLRRAIEEGAAEPAEERAMLIELGRLQRRVGDPDGIATLRRAFAAAAGTPEHAEAAVELAATALTAADFGTAAKTVEAVRGVEATRDQGLLLDLLEAEALWGEGRLVESMRLIERIPADLPGDTPAQRLVLGVAGSIRLMRSDPRAVDMLIRSVGEDGTAPGALGGIDLGDPLSWLIVAEALDEAEALAEERVEHARAAGDEAVYAQTQNTIGWLLGNRGELRASVAAYRLGLAQPALGTFLREHIVLNLVEILIWQGELEQAEQELASMDFTGRAAAVAEARQAEIALARGDPAVAVGALERVHTEAALGLPDVNPNVLVLAADLAAALDGAGRRDEAVALLEDLIARAQRTGATYAEIQNGWMLGRITDDLDTLERAVERAAASPYRFHEARARLDLGAALRRRGRRVDAREHLRLALDYGERQGARGIADGAREELRLAGARPRRAVLTGADSLTPAEARIARLAAAGRSNKEIAQHLFVTVKTVEMNLVRAYRKLDISSRRELPDALAS